MTADVVTLEKHSPNLRSIAALVAAGFITIAGLLQFFIAAFGIPRFSGVYRDMLGDHALPSSTVIVLHCRWLLMSLAFIWPLAASFLLQRRAPKRYLFFILALLLLTIAFVTVALFLPLVGDIIAITPPQ